ncbi:MAG: hypothetical protein ACLFU4_01310 [Opitutales bacterium]
MNFRLASTFNDSLLKLTGEEQKAVKTTVFDLQLDPSNPGMSFHKLDKAEDKDFWSGAGELRFVGVEYTPISGLEAHRLTLHF